MKTLLSFMLMVSFTPAHAITADAFVKKFIDESYRAISEDSSALASLCQIVARDVKLQGPNGLVTNAIMAGNWDKASEPERAAFVAAAKSYMINQLAQTFHQYSGDPNAIQYKIEGDNVIAVVPDMEPTKVTVEQQAGGQWLIVDAIYQGMSVLKAQQDVIRGAITKNGIAKMTQVMNKKSQDLMGICP